MFGSIPDLPFPTSIRAIMFKVILLDLLLGAGPDFGPCWLPTRRPALANKKHAQHLALAK